MVCVPSDSFLLFGPVFRNRYNKKTSTLRTSKGRSPNNRWGVLVEFIMEKVFHNELRKSNLRRRRLRVGDKKYTVCGESPVEEINTTRVGES